MGESLLVAALYTAAACALTWPLVTHLTSHLPLGNLSNATLPYFNLWTLEWNADRWQHGLAGYWHAPIFHPEPHAFALSEPLALAGVVFALAAPVFGNVAGYDLTLLLILVLNGVAARRVLRVAEISPLAATAGGVLAIALPFTLKELGVLQLSALFPALFALAELCVLFRAPSWPALMRLGLWFAAALWTCLYYALFLTVFFALAAGMLLRRSLRNRAGASRRRSLLRAPIGGAAPALRGRAAFAGAGAALLIAGAAALPIATVQRATVAPYARSQKTIRTGSALARDYATLAPRTLGARVLALPAPRGRALFPGAVLLALAVTGLWCARRGPWRRWLLFCAACALLAALLSFGTRLAPFGMSPYELLWQRHWPGFAQLRSPYRFAAFAQIFLLPLAGYGLDHVLHAVARRRGRAIATTLLVLIVASAWLEVVPPTQKLVRFPSASMHEPWIAWLQRHPGGAVAMLPPEASKKARDFEPIVLAMLQGLRHGHALVNGYSGFFPPRSVRLMSALRHFPDARSVRALQHVGVRYAVCDRAFVAAHPQLAASSSGTAPGPSFGETAPALRGGAWLHAVHADAQRVIYEITADDARVAP